MGTELEELAGAAGRLAAGAAGRPELAGRAARLEERLRTGRFYIAVLGEFKRGKSTLVNALLGAERLARAEADEAARRAAREALALAAQRDGAGVGA